MLCVLVLGLMPPAAAQEKTPTLTTEGRALQPWEHDDHGWERGFKILGDDFLYLAMSPASSRVNTPVTGRSSTTHSQRRKRRSSRSS